MKKLFFALMALAAIALVGCKDKKDEPEMNIDCSLPDNAEAVDLGLPSDTKWANMNVGATKPEENGAFFAWGEISPKEVYDVSTYKWCKGSEKTLTKYCTDSKYGTVDNKTVLEPADDAAHVNWGGDWRMPTGDEITELINKCQWDWQTDYQGISGLNGYKVSSKVKGNTNFIFLPVAGFRIDNQSYDIGKNGCCWASSLSDYSPRTYGIYFYSEGVVKSDASRYIGQSVRPVCK